MTAKMLDLATTIIEENDIISCFRRNCDQCVLKKIKCDGSKPCSLCSRKGADCIYSAKRKPGPKTRHSASRSLSNSSNDEPPSKRLRPLRTNNVLRQASEHESDDQSASPSRYRFRPRTPRSTATASSLKDISSREQHTETSIEKEKSLIKSECIESTVTRKQSPSPTSLKSSLSLSDLYWSSCGDDSDDDCQPYGYLNGSRIAAELLFGPRIRIHHTEADSAKGRVI